MIIASANGYGITFLSVVPLRSESYLSVTPRTSPQTDGSRGDGR